MNITNKASKASMPNREKYQKMMEDVYIDSKECYKLLYDPHILTINLSDFGGDFMYKFDVVGDIRKISEVYFVLNHQKIKATLETIEENKHRIKAFDTKIHALPIRYMPYCNTLLCIKVSDVDEKNKIYIHSKRIYSENQTLFDKGYYIPVGTGYLVVMGGYASYIDETKIKKDDDVLDVTIKSTI